MLARRLAGRLFVATLGVAAVLPVEPASASGSVTLAASASTVAPGSTVDLTASMPVVGAGTLTQEIVQTIDPTKVKLTSLSDITYPSGWTLSYSTDGTSFSATTPASSAAWAAVRAVKASGNVSSQGSENGYQIATGTASGGTVSLSPGNITASGSGDGFQVFFDPGRTRVFNVFHHMINGAALDCHVISTGATCAGFPFNPGIAATGQYSTGRVVGTKIWIPIYTSNATAAQSTASFRCVDISAVLSSGGSPALCATSNVVMATGDLSADRAYSNVAFTAFQMIDGVSLSGSNAESKIWGVIARTGNLVCLDTALSAACSGMPANGWATQVKGTRFNTKNDGVQTSIVKWGNNIYIKGSTSNTADGNLVIGCVLASDPTQACTGFTSTGKDLGANSTAQKVGRLVLLPNALGEVQGACLLGDTRTLTVIAPVRVATSAVAVRCWDSSGTEFLGPASLSNLVTATFNTGFSEYQFPVQKGTRIYWGNGINFAGSADYPPRALCWDAALNSGAGGLCTGLPAGSATVSPGYITDNYTVSPDPEIDNCMWVTRHEQPNIISVDIVNNVVGCSRAAPVRATFAGSAVVPRLACSTTSTAVREWKSFTLTSPAPSVNFTAVLSVRATSGAVIDGWQRVPITAGAPVSLSSLDPTVTGATPSFLVDFTVSSGSVSTATAAVQVVGDAPQLCLRPTTQAVCPAGTGPVTGLSSSSMTATATGSTTNSSNVTTTLGPASTTITISVATTPQCGATLSGTATVSGTSTGIAGATVTLLDSSGNPILGSNGQPITTTTGSDGTYSFGYLFPGAYKVKFDNTTGGATTSTVTVTDGGSGSVSPLPELDCSTGTASTVEDPTGSGLLRQVVSAPVLTRTSPANLIVNGDFTTRPTTSLGGATTGGDILIPGTVGDKIPGWTSSGGGASTYAKWTISGSAYTPDGASSNHYYFGNNSGWSTSPTFNPTAAFNANGVTQTSYTFTPGYAGYGNNSSPVTLSQTIATTAGRTYRFQFWQASELWGSTPGIAAFDISGYSRTFFKVNDTVTAGLANSWRRYTFEFTATQATTTISVMSWGHIGVTADELKIDDVIVNRCGSADVSVISNSTTLAVGTNGVVNAVYTVPAAAAADTSTGAQGAAQTINVKANDTASTGANLTSPTINFCTTDSPASGCTLTTKTVSGQGVYTISGGNVVFTPCSAANTPAGAGCTGAFTGTATPVAYRITDSAGSTATSTITPTVVPVPTAVNDTSSGNYNTAQTRNILANDTAGTGATLSASSIRLCNPTTTPAQTPNNCTVAAGSTITVPNVGTYSVNASGVVTFTPAANFSGTAPALSYQVQDSLGQYGSATYTPTVLPPPVPSATADTSTGLSGVVQTVNPVTNDVVGATGMTFTASSVRLCSTGQTAPGCTATSLAVPGQGTYSVNTTTGVVTFTPCSAANTPAGASCTGVFAGTATPVSYQVSTNTSQVASSTYTPTVIPPPTAVADTGSGNWDVNQTFTPTSNDSAGSGTTLRTVPSGICANGTAVGSCTGTTVTVANQGTYTLNTTTGVVTFDPLPSFTGTATPIQYVVSDALNQKTAGTITPTVVPPAPPAATPQQKVVLPSGTITFTSLTGTGGLATTSGPAFASSSTCLVDPADSVCKSSVAIAGEGTWTINTGTGVVTFVATSGITTGTKTPVTYRVTDVTGQTATSTLTPIVPPPPTLADDTSVNEQNATQVINVLANDSASAHTTLSSTSVKLCPANATAPFNASNCSLSTLTVPDEGRYTANSDGTVSFVPCNAAPSAACPANTKYSGVATSVRYVAQDNLGQFGSALITPTVLPPPVAQATNDTGSALFGRPVTFTPTSNDSGGTTTGLVGYTSTGTATITPTSVRLCSTGQSAPNCTATSLTTADGVYAVDTSTGSITFTPATNFTGTPVTPPTYMVCNTIGGNWQPMAPPSSCASALVIPTIAPPVAPTAVNDTSSGPHATPQTITVLGNDTKDPALTLVASSVRLCGSGQVPPNCTLTSLTVAGEGTYVVNNDGTVTFTPLASFRGTVATPPRYQVADSFGTVVSATITPTVSPPQAPTATPETKTVIAGGTATFTGMIGTGALASGTGLQTGNVAGPCIVDPSDAVCKDTFTVSGEGTWTVDRLTGVAIFEADGAVTSGTKTAVTYRVTDVTGQTASSTLTPVVPPAAAPTNDTSIDALDVNQTFNVLSNDLAGTGTTFVASSVRLCGIAGMQTAPNCTLMSVTVSGEGTYTVNPDGSVTFDPEPTFAGTATPVGYQVADSFGRVVSAMMTPTVTSTPPVATPGTVTLAAGTSATFSPLHGTGGLASPAASGPALVANTACIVNPATSTCGTSVTIAGEGTFTLDLATGVVTYTALATATAGVKTAVTYRVTDAVGFVATSTLTPTVWPKPTASPDVSSGAKGATQKLTPLANDSAGSTSHPLVPSTLRFCGVGEAAPSCTKTTLTVAGEGTYTVEADGSVTFVPEANFSGTATKVTYIVKDSIDQVAVTTITVRVDAGADKPVDGQSDTSGGKSDTSDNQSDDTAKDPADDGPPLPSAGGSPFMLFLAGALLASGAAATVTGRRLGSVRSRRD